MNIQEAINLLKENKINIRIGMGILEDVKLGTSLSEAIELAIKALEKQIQKTFTRTIHARTMPFLWRENK